MRQIGTLENEAIASRFVDFLKTLHISAQADEDDGAWMIWVKDENHVDSARQELAEFRTDPDAEQYRDVARRADKIRYAEVEKRVAVKKNVKDMRGSWNGPISKRAPVVMYLIIACIAAAVLGGGFRSQSFVDRFLMFVDFGNPENLSTFRDVLRGQIWRLATPILLHGGVLHLLFNLYWLYQLGQQIESKISSPRFLLLVLATAVIPNVLQAVLVGPNFLGISGVVYGLFGYMLVRRNDGYRLDQFIIIIFLVFFVLDFTPMGLHRGIAIWAHAGGLATGAFIGYLPTLLAGR